MLRKQGARGFSLLQLVILVGDLSYSDTYAENGRHLAEDPRTVPTTYEPRWDTWGRFVQPLAAKASRIVSFEMSMCSRMASLSTWSWWWGSGALFDLQRTPELCTQPRSPAGTFGAASSSPWQFGQALLPALLLPCCTCSNAAGMSTGFRD